MHPSSAIWHQPCPLHNLELKRPHSSTYQLQIDVFICKFCYMQPLYVSTACTWVEWLWRNTNAEIGLHDADLGILHSAEFQDLNWNFSRQRATMSDILRVHEWSYISLLQKASDSCTETRFAALDSDTIISKGSFSAALAAAGAVITAVDNVMTGQVSY